MLRFKLKKLEQNFLLSKSVAYPVTAYDIEMDGKVCHLRHFVSKFKIIHLSSFSLVDTIFAEW